jgi:hypothetical protein
MDSKRALWNDFCREHRVLEESVPLFDVGNGVVQVVSSPSKNGRLLLKRGAQMEALVAREAGRVIADWRAGCDELEGLIYMMCWREPDGVLPLYIGKTEKYGRDGTTLSANIDGVVTRCGEVGNRTAFCRWGDGYAYHVGDLSAVVCPGHPSDKIAGKYRRWAAALFENAPTTAPILRQPTFFWAKAWSKGAVGPWQGLGPTSLTFLEYLLIGLASATFPGLLNSEGVNRLARAGEPRL